VWKDFRKFLADLGPAPNPDYLATRLAATDLTYGPGKVAWMHRDRQPQLTDLMPQAKPVSADCQSQWLTVQGTTIEYSALAQLLGVPFEAMAVALRSGVSPDTLVQQASIAEALIRVESPWMSPERRDAFMTAYRMWHMQVQPNYAASATPAFLFVYSALPRMLKLMSDLEALGLWDPPTVKGQAQRRDHDLWRRYCESMTRVESARIDCPLVARHSLTSQLKEIWEQVRKLEARIRSP